MKETVLIKKLYLSIQEEIDFIKFLFHNEPLRKEFYFSDVACINVNDCMPLQFRKRFITFRNKNEQRYGRTIKLFNIMETEDIFVSKIYQGTIYYHAGSKVKHNRT